MLTFVCVNFAFAFNLFMYVRADLKTSEHILRTDREKKKHTFRTKVSSEL